MKRGAGGKLILGLLAAPLAGTISATLIINHKILGIADPAARDLIAATLIGTGVLNYLLMILGGLPAHFLLKRLRLSSYAAYAGSGLLIAILFLLIFFSRSLGSLSRLPELWPMLAAALIGGILSSLSFWLILRPDRAIQSDL